MSTKNIIFSLVGVIVIGGAIYFSMSKKSTDIEIKTMPPVSATQTEKKEIIQEPAKDASTDQIIDYIVDGQSGDETRAAQASLETSATAEAEPTINTNF
jgi:hypothetical protein